jgi:hypothetical protein
LDADIVADLYAEVVGIVAQSRFLAVKNKFLTELKELRSRDQNSVTSRNIVNLLMGMKFFRVKVVAELLLETSCIRSSLHLQMHPMAEFQSSILFLNEIGNYFIEVRDKEVKHALGGLLVEILLPVAAVSAFLLYFLSRVSVSLRWPRMKSMCPC